MILAADRGPEARSAPGRRPTPAHTAKPESGRAEATAYLGRSPLPRSTERAAPVPVHGEGVRHQGEAHQLEHLADAALRVARRSRSVSSKAG